MNKTLLQVFLLLAFIPLAILVGYGVLVVAPIFCCLRNRLTLTSKYRIGATIVRANFACWHLGMRISS